jgi:hypothetical protein
MNLQTLINDCHKSGVSLQFNKGLLKLNGEPEKVKTAAIRLRPYKAELVKRFRDDVAIQAWLAYINETDPQIIADVIKQCHDDKEANEYFLGRAGEVNKPLQRSGDTNTPPDTYKRSQAHPGGRIA